MKILAYIFISLSTIIYAFSLLVHTRKKLLFFQICSSLLFIIHYFLLSAFVGGIIATIELIRIIVFYFYENKTTDMQKAKIITSILFSIIGIACAIFTWEGWYSIFPLVGLIVVNICLSLKNLTLLKFAYLFNVSCALTYMIFISSYFSGATQVVIILIGVIGLIHDKIKANKLKKEETNEQKNI